MAIFDHPKFKNHQEVHFFRDEATGLKAIIAVHHPIEGRSAGGCRFYPYPSEEDALADVLLLSRAMTYKFSLAGIPLGGAKSVIIGDPRNIKTKALLQAFGRCVASLGGRYTVGGDVGTTEDDMLVISGVTDHVAGVKGRDGDTAPMTAYGVSRAMAAAWYFQSGQSSLAGAKVAVQGLGGVGMHLADYLAEAGAELIVTDINEQAVAKARSKGWAIADVNDILQAEVDILAPCALGDILTTENLPLIPAKVICGGANNQLEHEGLIHEVEALGKVFVPDFIANAGGAITATGYMAGKDQEAVLAHADEIYDTTLAVLQSGQANGVDVMTAAYQLAEERLGK